MCGQNLAGETEARRRNIRASQQKRPGMQWL